MAQAHMYTDAVTLLHAYVWFQVLVKSHRDVEEYIPHADLSSRY